MVDRGVFEMVGIFYDVGRNSIMLRPRELDAGYLIPSILVLVIGASLLSAVPAFAQGSCDVVVQLDDPGMQTLFALGVDYQATGGAFIGNSSEPSLGGIWGPDPIACTNLVSQFYSALDDKAGTLSLFFADTNGLTGPLPLISCVFEFGSGFSCPAPDDFVIGLDAFPAAPVMPDFPPVPAVSIASVTQRTAVCGDGFREAPEECDDGNVDDGDCCSSSCTLDVAGTPCPDASVCTSDELCDGAGTCVIGNTVTCDDGVLCTYDVCDPQAGCVASVAPTPVGSGCDGISKAKLNIRNKKAGDTADRVKLTVKFVGGDVGDPALDTDYAVCIFDRLGGIPVLVSQIDIPAGPPWLRPSAKPRFKYFDALRSNDGVEKVRIGQNKKQVGKLRLLGNGVNLPLPAPFDPTQYLAQDPSVTMEIQNSAGACWSVTYESSSSPINSVDHFKARSGK